VLNKFPINPHHFILATKEYKEQAHMLEEDDIEAAYACLKKYSQAGEELFGFFNSGEHSGASQPHRHIQFLPVESMQSGMRASDEWSVLADNLAKKPSMYHALRCKDLFLTPIDLPFTYFWSAILEDIAAQQLYSIYLELHKKAVQSMGISALSSNRETASPISYNLAITNKGMVVCPRTSEGITITSTKGERIGPVALNGTLLAGTLLVKSEAEWDMLRNDESMLIEILSSIGVSSIKKDKRI
jgi:ATP adenylyltransferase